MDDTPNGAVQPDPAQRLMGWKEIGAYLGRSARTVQRWERDLGLPVHRIATEHEGQIVFAAKSEIDSWVTLRATESAKSAAPEADDTVNVDGPPVVATTPDRVSWWQRRPVAVAAAGCVLILVTIWTAWHRDGWFSAAPTVVAGNGLEHPLQYFTSTSGVVVFDELSGRIVREIPLPEYADFSTLIGGRRSPDGTEIVFVTLAQAGTISLDLRSESWTTWLPTAGQRLTSAAVSADGGLGMALDHDGVATIFNRRTRQVIDSLAVPLFGADVAPIGNTNHFVLAARNDGLLTIVDGDTARTLSSIKAGESVGQLAVTRDGKTLYVVNHYHRQMSCVDVEAGTITSVAAAGAMPWTIALSPDERWVYVGNRDDNSVSIVDAVRCATVRTIDSVHETPQVGALSVGMGGQRLYVAHPQSATVAVFDLSGGPETVTRVATVRPPREVQGIIASPASSRR